MLLLYDVYLDNIEITMSYAQPISCPLLRRAAVIIANLRIVVISRSFPPYPCPSPCPLALCI